MGCRIDHRRRTALLPALLAVLLAAGCAQVPVHGPVVAAPEGGTGDIGSVRIEARGPQPGASPEQIVQGFLDAMSTYDVGFPLAKEFLTAEAESSWSLSPIVVYDQPDLAETADSAVSFSAQKVAEIDVDGQYTPAASDAPLTVTLPMVEESGEWRISEPPPGLLITTLDRDNDYSPYITYYPSPDSSVLVPDLVWLPGVGPPVATLLAQALVDGPTARLGGSVRSAFPEGTSATSVSVRSGGIATVALAGPVAAADPAAIQEMAAQLVYTLRGVGVVGTELVVDGSPLEVPGVAGPLTPTAFADRDALAGHRTPAAYALVDDRLVTIDTDSGAVTPVAGPFGESAAGARAVAVDLDESLAATVSGNGRTVTAQRLDGSAEPIRQTFTGVDVAPPSWDRYGNLWVVDRIPTRGSTVYVIAPDGSGRDTKIQAPALDARRVLALRVAPDGARVAASIQTDDGTSRLLFLRVVRSSAGISLTGVSDPAALPDLESVSDLAWSSETEVAAVVQAPGRAARAALVRVDASTVSPKVQTGVTSVAAYPQQPLLAVTEGAAIRREESAITWADLAAGTAVTYPG